MRGGEGGLEGGVTIGRFFFLFVRFGFLLSFLSLVCSVFLSSAKRMGVGRGVSLYGSCRGVCIRNGMGKGGKERVSGGVRESIV